MSKTAGWSTIYKLLVLALILTACNKDNSYQGQDIKIRESQKTSYKDELAIGLDYRLIRDSNIYSDPDESTAFDTLEKDSLVTVILEEENGFVYVSFAGDSFYIKAKNLENI